MFMRGSNLCEDLATSLFKEFATDENNFSGNGRNEGAVVIVDRRLDLVTPILNQVRKYLTFDLSFVEGILFLSGLTKQ